MSILIEEIEKCRRKVQTLINYTNVLIPLVYTQVVIIAVYSYFLLQLFSQQFINAKNTAAELSRQLNRSVQPIHIVEFAGSAEHHTARPSLWTIESTCLFRCSAFFRFLFLMGWMKVAMCLINPFGNDDEDFQILDIFKLRSAFSSYSAYPEPIVSGSLRWAARQTGFDGGGFMTYLRRTNLELSAYYKQTVSYFNQLRENACMAAPKQILKNAFRKAVGACRKALLLPQLAILLALMLRSAADNGSESSYDFQTNRREATILVIATSLAVSPSLFEAAVNDTDMFKLHSVRLEVPTVAAAETAQVVTSL
uniref:Bestrophin homolog n=1 Tax=Macrostomum lignano TaxID=282301 RepID=A0A1I8FEK4_9PLAT